MEIARMPRAGKTKDLLGVISRKDAESFLLDLANYPQVGDYTHPAFHRFVFRWGKFFSAYDVEDDTDELDLFEFLVFWLCPYMRMAWSGSSPREREWYVHKVRQIYNEDRVLRSEEGRRLNSLKEQQGLKVREDFEKLVLGLPPPNPIDAALQYFQQVVGQASVCQNPLCQHPHFLAAKFAQKYCSDLCARPAQKEAKQKWWRKRGAEWREQQKKKRKSKKKE
jgi:hypothetical protein